MNMFCILTVTKRVNGERCNYRKTYFGFDEKFRWKMEKPKLKQTTENDGEEEREQIIKKKPKTKYHNNSS